MRGSAFRLSPPARSATLRAPRRSSRGPPTLPLNLAQVLGLYGNAAPGTVSNFLALVESGDLVETTFQRVFPGQWIQAGGQGSHRLGRVQPRPGVLKANPDVADSKSFKLAHNRPGTLTLLLAEGVSADDEGVRSRPGYVGTEFAVTTGPGPVPALDGEAIVFGRVLEGIDVVADVAAVRAFNPAANVRGFNLLGQILNDERAARAKRNWGSPLQAVVIDSATLLE